MEGEYDEVFTHTFSHRVSSPKIVRTERETKTILPISNILTEALRKEAGEEILEYISDKFSLRNHEKILFISKTEELYNQVDLINLRVIINLQKVNTQDELNQHFKSINKLLPDGGSYVGCVQTYEIRKELLKKKYGKRVASIIWFADSLINRAIPRLKLTSPLYKRVARRKNKAISLAETLGRLVYCGFDIIETRRIRDNHYFEVLKTSEPVRNNPVPTGLFFPMKRVGKNGETITVYKVRTMHPYSEYIQDYVLKLKGYNSVGKPAEDFRITTWGKFLRKYWLDEFPQILNVLQGNMHLVGVRPLSMVRYNEFPEDLKYERIKFKPGCIPPYVALCMPDAKGNIEAERIYLRDLGKGVLATNTRYLFLAMYNIFTNKIRSA